MRYNNFMAASMRSEITDVTGASEQMQDSLSTSVGQFSRVMNSSLTLSRSIDPAAIYANRSPLQGTQQQRDPLSVINLYAKKNASKTPDPISVAVPEEDSDFERDNSPSWRNSSKKASCVRKKGAAQAEKQDTTLYFRDNRAVDSS